VVLSYAEHVEAARGQRKLQIASLQNPCKNFADASFLWAGNPGLAQAELAQVAAHAARTLQADSQHVSKGASEYMKSANTR